MQLQAGAATDVGKVRKHNEDAHTCQPRLGLFVVCDGMGGEAAGEVASQLGIRTVLEQLNGAAASAPPRAGFLPRTSQLEAAVLAANRAIYEAAHQNVQHTGMGTTIVSAWLGGDIASLAHVGDSRAYLWHDGQFEQITRDHSLVEEQVRAGLLTREQSFDAKNQNILLRALGKEPQVEVELGELPLRPGDYLLLCSDGLSRLVPDAVLGETIARLRDPQRIAEELVRLANEKGGVDNITAVVVRAGRESFWKRLWKRGRP